MDIYNFDKTLNDYNTNPLDDFLGFSPKEMHLILYNPFEDSCPMKIKKKISNATLERIPAFRICKNILTDIEKADGIKLTKIGNLPPKTVISIYNKKYLQDYHIDSGITKLRNEKDWRTFHSLHISMGLGGLIRKYKSKALLTKKCKSLLSNNDESGLFKELLLSYCTKFNWAYNDNYDNQYTGQFGFLFLIHLLLKYQSEPCDLKFITDKYFNAFPKFQMVDDYNSRSYYTTGDRVVETRFFHRFGEWFGLVETHEDKSEPYWERRSKIVVSNILNDIVEYSKESDKE